MQRSASDVRQRQHLEHAAVDDLFNDFGRGQRREGVENSLAPWAHLLGFSAWQVSQVLTTNGEERAENHDPTVLSPLKDCFQAGAQSERGLARTRATTEGDDADVRVEKQVERNALLSTAPMKSERLTVAAHEPDLLVSGDAS